MSALTDPTTFLGEDGLRQATEYVPGAARNDGMPSQRVAYAEAVRAIQAPSPTAPKDSQWEEEGPLEGAPNRDPDQIPIAPVVVFPKPIFSASRSELLQQWEGTVVEVDSGWMKVTLDSLTEHESTEEQATIELDEVPDADRSLVEVGAVFYWSIGYRVEPHGQKTLTSNIRFRRLPAWTSTEIQRAKSFAAKFDILFENDD